MLPLNFLPEEKMHKKMVLLPIFFIRQGKAKITDVNSIWDCVYVYVNNNNNIYVCIYIYVYIYIYFLACFCAIYVGYNQIDWPAGLS